MLVKPGPQVAVGLVLKGLAFGTSVAQNIVGDATIADLLGNGTPTTKPIVPESLFPPIPQLAVFAPDGVSPLGTAISTRSGNGQTDVIWTQSTDGSYVKTELVTMKNGEGVTQSVNFTQYRYSSEGTPLGADTYMYDKQGTLQYSGSLLPSADGQSWVSDPSGTPAGQPGQDLFSQGANSHTIVVKTGTTLSAIVLAQKNAGNDITLADVLATNPKLTDVDRLDAGDVLYVPRRQADGSTTYYYEGGTHINNNTRTGEYDMAVYAKDGSRVEYRRHGNANTGYDVTQLEFDAAGQLQASHMAYQPGRLGDREAVRAAYEEAEAEYNRINLDFMHAALAGNVTMILALLDDLTAASGRVVTAMERWAPFAVAQAHAPAVYAAAQAPVTVADAQQSLTSDLTDASVPLAHTDHGEPAGQHAPAGPVAVHAPLPATGIELAVATGPLAGADAVGGLRMPHPAQRVAEAEKPVPADEQAQAEAAPVPGITDVLALPPVFADASGSAATAKLVLDNIHAGRWPQGILLTPADASPEHGVAEARPQAGPAQPKAAAAASAFAAALADAGMVMDMDVSGSGVARKSLDLTPDPDHTVTSAAGWAAVLPIPLVLPETVPAWPSYI